MFKKFFATMLLAVTLVFIGAQDNTAEARFQVVGIRTYLSIREEPTIYSRELARVPNGTILNHYIGGRDSSRPIGSNGFWMVGYRGIQGWASSQYLVLIDWQ